jgi:ubiquinone/menaquinone biosynthesis C-methylase UbiE
MNGICRPGGLALTDRLLAACAFRPGARILDLGCGAGTTVRHLLARGLAAMGVDRDPAALAGPGPFLCALAERLPLADRSLDGVLMECSLSETDDPDRVLDQCRRVLRPGGRLGLTDLYARSGEARRAGGAGRLQSRTALAKQLEAHGFQPEWFEDCTPLLQAYFCQLVLDPGACGGRILSVSGAAELWAAKAGYCLLTARRRS